MPDGPGRFPQGFSCPAVLRSHWKEDCIFVYGAVTLFGRTFQTVRLTLPYPSFHLAIFRPPFRGTGRPPGDCGPATPGSPFESPGLGCSEFARHYYRNHCCFLFLWVLRWFTSPGSLPAAMYSLRDDGCSHPPGSPIRKSSDHSVLATPRGLSQLAASFVAYLRQGIHTHALSSLTIKFTLNTDVFQALLLSSRTGRSPRPEAASSPAGDLSPPASPPTSVPGASLPGNRTCAL